jgi:L-asparaginase II
MLDGDFLPPDDVRATDPIRIEVTRSTYVESVHRVAACVVEVDGTVLYAAGDVDRAYPVRSLAKPFVAAELVRSGAAAAYALDDAELAVITGSHDGEEIHVRAVRAILERIGLDEGALRCGPAMENAVVVGPPVANNCSGKHAGVLTLCRYLGLDVDTYLDPDHPVQRRLTARAIADFGRESRVTRLAIDGCGMPIFGATLREMAHAYARFGVHPDPALMRVRAAIAAAPAYFGGSGRNFDTALVAASAGEVIGKIGAEGLHGDAILAERRGIAVKVLDGNSRAMPGVVLSLLARFASAHGLGSRALIDFAQGRLHNAAGTTVGGVRFARPR